MADVEEWMARLGVQAYRTVSVGRTEVVVVVEVTCVLNTDVVVAMAELDTVIVVMLTAVDVVLSVLIEVVVCVARTSEVNVAVIDWVEVGVIVLSGLSRWTLVEWMECLRCGLRSHCNCSLPGYRCDAGASRTCNDNGTRCLDAGAY